MPRWCGASGITVTGAMMLHFMLSLQVVVVLATLVLFPIAMRRLSLGCELTGPWLMRLGVVFAGVVRFLIYVASKVQLAG